MSNARKVAKLIVGTEVKVTGVDSDLSTNLSNIKTRLDSDDAAIQAANTLAVQSTGEGLTDSDLKVVASLRDELDSEILSVRSLSLSYTNYFYTATAGQTAFTGSDDNSATLSYTSGAIQVFLNGVILDPNTDYTATDGTTVTLTEAAAVGHQLSILTATVKSTYTPPVPPPDWGGMKIAIFAENLLNQNYRYSCSAALSGDGLYAAVGNLAGRKVGGSQYMDYGGYHFYKNGSGDETDNSTWDLVARIDDLPVRSGGPTGAAFSMGTSADNMNLGAKKPWLNAGGTKICFPFSLNTAGDISTESNYQKMVMYVLGRNDSDNSYDSDINDYASFNPFAILSDPGTISGTSGSQFHTNLAKHFDVSDDVDRIAYYVPRYTSSDQTGAVAIVKRTGTEFALEQQINHDDLRTGFNTTSAKPGNFGISMDADGTKVVASSTSLSTGSETGGFTTFLRSGSTWSVPDGGTIYGSASGTPGAQANFGAAIDMSRDGNYCAVTAYHTNNTSWTDNHIVRIYEWNSSTDSWDKQADIVPRNDNCGIEYVHTDRLDGVKLNKEGNVCMVFSSQDDDSDNLQANTSVIRFYTRSGSTWTGVSHKTGSELWGQGTDVPSTNYTGGKLSTFQTAFSSNHKIFTETLDMSDSGRTVCGGARDLMPDVLYGTGSPLNGIFAILHDS